MEWILASTKKPKVGKVVLWSRNKVRMIGYLDEDERRIKYEGLNHFEWIGDDDAWTEVEKPYVPAKKTKQEK